MGTFNNNVMSMALIALAVAIAAAAAELLYGALERILDLRHGMFRNRSPG